MNGRVAWSTVFLAGLLGVPSAGWSQAPAQPPAPPNPKVETVATLPSPGGTENLCRAADGSIYVTGIDDRVVWKVEANGSVSQFTGIPIASALLGIGCGDNQFALVVFGLPFRKPAATPGGPAVLDFSDVSPSIRILDSAGKTTAIIIGQKGQAFNGLTYAGKGIYLAADSNGAAIWRIDAAKQTITPWLKDDLLAKTAQVSIGANGIKIHDNVVYVSVTATNTIYKVEMDANGAAKGGLTKFAEGVRTDDFDVGPDGTLYLVSGPTLYSVSPKGEVKPLLENVPGNGASTVVSTDGKWVYWPTRGGTAPQRLVRAPTAG